MAYKAVALNALARHSELDSESNTTELVHGCPTRCRLGGRYDVQSRHSEL